ncbi:MAG: DUF3618 domain-containing protein [Nocardioides sp.]
MTDDVTHQPQEQAPGSNTAGIAELQADIERTRDDLAETVDRLAAKLDVKSRLRSRMSTAGADSIRQVRALRSRATELQPQASPRAVGIGAGTLAAALGIVVVVRWRRGHTNRPWARRR